MPSFYGEQGCEALYGSGDKEGQKCTNKAYYRQGIRLLCGVHSSPSTRSKLPKNPNAAQEKEDKYKVSILTLTSLSATTVVLNLFKSVLIFGKITDIGNEMDPYTSRFANCMSQIKQT